MATPENTLWDKAALAFNTAEQNRHYLVNSGKTVELGDSGVRNLSGVLQNVTAGTVYAQRVGELVTVTAEALVTSGVGNLVIAPRTIPGILSLRPTSRTVWAALFTTAGVARIGFSPNGDLYVHNPFAGQTASGSLTFVTSEEWFNASRPLPGVAFGEPTGV